RRRGGLERERRLRRHRDERDRDEREQEDHGREGAEGLPGRGQLRDVVEWRGVAHSEEEDDQGEQEPARVDRPEGEEEEDRAPGEELVPLPEERAGDVPAIELAGREEVDRGHEEPDPARERG